MSLVFRIIKLLIQNKYDEAFGNIIWENEFTNITKNNSLKEKIKDSLLETILKYEHRLENVKVEVQMFQEEGYVLNTKRLRERINIETTAIIKKTKEKFFHQEYFYIAPLSQY